MRQLNLVILLAALTLLSSTCGDDDCEVVPGGKKYNARVPVTYSPMQAYFKVGDTISVEIQVPNEVKDTISGELLQIGDVVFDDVWGGNIGGGVVRFFKSQQDSTKWLNAANEFVYVQRKGKVQVTGGNISALAVTFSGEADKRTAIFQMIPQKPGLYNLGFFTPALNVTGQFGTYCSATLQLNFGDNTAHNYHLIKEFDVKKVGTYQQNIGTFSFLVEE